MDQETSFRLWLPTASAAAALVAGIFLAGIPPTYVFGLVVSIVFAILAPLLFIFTRAKPTVASRCKMRWLVVGAIFFALASAALGLARLLAMPTFENTVADIGGGPSWLLGALGLLTMTVLFAVVEIKAHQSRDTLRYLQKLL